MSQHGVNDLPTAEPTLDTLRLSKAQKHALYTLIESVRPKERTLTMDEECDEHGMTAWQHDATDNECPAHQTFNQALQDYDNAIKELLNE